MGGQNGNPGLKHRPNDADALVNAGMALVAANQMSEALVTFTRALEIDPAHAQARDHLSRIQEAGRP